MNKQPQNSARLSIGLLTLGIIATMALFFSSCKKKKEPPPVPVATETFYTVTFNSNGGTPLNAIKIKKGYTLTLLPHPTKTDFVFGGWFTDDKTFKNQFDIKTPITDDLALYAKWDVPEYTVTFNSNGGSEVKPIQVKKGGVITLPASPTKTDFVFGGWFTDDKTFKNQFDAKTPIVAALTLYAKWNTVAPAVFTLSSTSFTNGGEIPPRCAFFGQPDRQNMSPQLSWANAPAGTKSFFIIVTNLSALGDDPLWVVNNIPASLTSLKESISVQEIRSSIPNLFLGEYSSYKGPKPPKGEKHTYQFTIYALKLADNYFSATNDPPESKAEADESLKDYILGKAFITGTFEAK